MTTCTGCPSLGQLTKLILEPGASPHTFDSGSIRIDYLKEDIQRKGRMVGAQGITGLAYRLADRSRNGGYRVGGSFLLNPSPRVFQNLLPYLVGPEALGVFTPGTCPQQFGLSLYMDSDVWVWKDCRVDSWILRGKGPAYDEKGEPDILTLQVNVIASDESGPNSTVPPTWPSPEPTLASGISAAAYLFSDCDGGIEINGESRYCYELALAWDNDLQVRYANSLTANSICPGNRQVRVQARFPWTAANLDLYDMDFQGAAAELAFTLENMSTVFNIANLQAPPETPIITGKTDAFFQLNGICGGTTTAPEMTVTNDATNT